MFRLFIMIAIALAMVLPASAQVNSECSFPRDAADEPTMGLVFSVPYGDRVLLNIFSMMIAGPNAYQWHYATIHLVEGSLSEGINGSNVSSLALPLRPVSFIDRVYEDEIYPELCNLERLDMLPERTQSGETSNSTNTERVRRYHE